MFRWGQNLSIVEDLSCVLYVYICTLSVCNAVTAVTVIIFSSSDIPSKTEVRLCHTQRL
jgi:hypothetical protein